MKTSNNFQISFLITADAKVNKFQTTSVARFGIAVTRKETVNGEEKKSVAFMNFEAWRKNENAADFDTLKKGKLITVEGYFKPEEYEKNGEKRQVIVFTATKWEEVIFDNNTQEG